MLLTSGAWAESFPIVPPKLLPRASGATQPGQTYPTQPANAQPTQATPAYGNAGSYGSTSYGNASPYGTTSPYGGTTSGSPAYGNSPGYVAPPSSPLGAAQSSGYSASYNNANLPAATIVQPQRAPEGLCQVELSPDRQTLELVSGPQALARDHVVLGDYRAQSVTHSPDGRWAVAFTKLRGAKQYAALVLDLQRCGLRQTYELPDAGESVSFDLDNAVLRYGRSEKRINLRAGRVQ
jgi:hypothetical protein